MRDFTAEEGRAWEGTMKPAVSVSTTYGSGPARVRLTCTGALTRVKIEQSEMSTHWAEQLRDNLTAALAEEEILKDRQAALVKMSGGNGWENYVRE